MLLVYSEAFAAPKAQHPVPRSIVEVGRTVHSTSVHPQIMRSDATEARL